MGGFFKESPVMIHASQAPQTAGPRAVARPDGRQPSGRRPEMDEAIQVLRGTHDGDELERGHLALVQHVVNCGIDSLSDHGREVWHQLVADVASGTYRQRGFHGQEALRIDRDGYVYWRGVRVEHFSYRDDEREREGAMALARNCRLLEARGVQPTAAALMRLWDEAHVAAGMPTRRFAVCWWVDDGMAASEVVELQSSDVDGLREELSAVATRCRGKWGAPNVRSVVVATREQVASAGEAIRGDIAWAQRAYQWLRPSGELYRMQDLSKLPDDLPTREEVLAFYAQQAGLAQSDPGALGETGAGQERRERQRGS